MWNEPTIEELISLPGHGDTVNINQKEKIVGMHFFIQDVHWYVVEFNEMTNSFLGFTKLQCDTLSVGWGRISLLSLQKMNVNGIEVTRDLGWQPKKVKEIPHLLFPKSLMSMVL